MIRSRLAPALVCVLLLAAALRPAVGAPIERRQGPGDADPAAAYVASARALREAMAKGYLTPVQRQRAKGDRRLLQDLIDIAMRYEVLSADRRQVRRVQAELLRQNDPGRQASLERMLLARTALKHRLITRAQKDALDTSPEGLATQIEVNRLIEWGYLTTAQARRAGLNRRFLSNLVDLAVSGERLHLPRREYRKMQDAYARRLTDERLQEARREIARRGLGLPAAVHESRLTGVEVVQFFGDAMWIGDAALAVFDETTWKTVADQGYDLGLLSVFRANHPEVPPVAYQTRSIQVLLEGRRTGQEIGADLGDPSYWTAFRKVHAGHDGGADLLRPFAEQVEFPAPRESGTSSEPATVHRLRVELHHPKIADARRQERFEAFLRHIDDLAGRGRWGGLERYDRLLDDQHDGSLASALAGLVPDAEDDV